jgi:hypothetical protein
MCHPYKKRKMVEELETEHEMRKIFKYTSVWIQYVRQFKARDFKTIKNEKWRESEI